MAQVECLDLLTTLEAYTVNAAYALRFDDCTGSLEAGKDASFTILDRNPLLHPVEMLVQARVVQTCFRCDVVCGNGYGALSVCVTCSPAMGEHALAEGAR